MTSLIPTSQWVYDLYIVTYYSDEECVHQVGGPGYIVSSCQNHLETDIQYFWPTPAAKWYRYDKVKENVGPPKKAGSLYGMDVTESVTSHTTRVLKQHKIKEA